jgi:hypothetical protein
MLLQHLSGKAAQILSKSINKLAPEEAAVLALLRRGMSAGKAG